MMISFKDRWRSWLRNARALVGDVAFSRNVKILGVVVFLSVLCFVALWCLGVGIKAEVYNQVSGRHVLTFHEYLFSVLGAIDADPDAAPVYAMYSAFVRLVGAIIIGGVLTSFLCSLLSRFSDMTLRGLLVPLLSDHVVIVGYTALTDDLIRLLLSDDGRDPFEKWFPYRLHLKRKNKIKILLYTSDDVQHVRDSLNSVLDTEMERRVVYAFGDMDMSKKKLAKEICQKLSLHRARVVIVLGDSCDPGRGDLKNLAFASVAGGYVRRRKIAVHVEKVNDMENVSELSQVRYGSENIPTPFYVQMDDVPTADLIKRMEYKIGSMVLRNNKADLNVEPSDLKLFRARMRQVDLGVVGVYIRPFSYFEGWARAIWGAPYMEKRVVKVKDDDGKVVNEIPYVVNYPLDFRPMDETSYVHLIVAGLGRAGEALVIEAIRICHYPRGEKTRITIVDPDPNVEMDFRVHHAEVFDLEDIEIKFLRERIQSEKARTLLETEAKNDDCLLTVAICLKNIEAAMFEGLCLPWDLYCAHDLPQSSVGGEEQMSKRLEHPERLPRILVYQEHVNGEPEEGESAPPIRYQYVRPFGMQEEGFQTKCMRSFSHIYQNAMFLWPLDADGQSFFDLLMGADDVKYDGETMKMIGELQKKWCALVSNRRDSDVPAGDRCRLFKQVLSLGDSVLCHFKKYAFRRFVMMDPVKEWINIYVPDSYGTTLRALGLVAKRLPTDEKVLGKRLSDEWIFHEESASDFKRLCEENERCFDDACERYQCGRSLDDARKQCQRGKSLEEVVHLRWMADRALMGYRAAPPERNEVCDDVYRYHNAMRPYAEIPEKEKIVAKNKDELVVRSIPLILALEGFAIKPK